MRGVCQSESEESEEESEEEEEDDDAATQGTATPLDKGLMSDISGLGTPESTLNLRKETRR
jgi:U3 small nucleolar RNA-associated protein 14